MISLHEEQQKIRDWSKWPNAIENKSSFPLSRAQGVVHIPLLFFRKWTKRKAKATFSKPKTSSGRWFQDHSSRNPFERFAPRLVVFFTCVQWRMLDAKVIGRIAFSHVNYSTYKIVSDFKVYCLKFFLYIQLSVSLAIHISEYPLKDLQDRWTMMLFFEP